MDEILIRRREVLLNNLVLLGLDRLAVEKKHGIKFAKDMFVLPNKKGYEVVTHFLFSKLAAVTGKDFNLPWPLIGKEHDRIFQKTSFTHLTTFAQENYVRFPRLVPSLLSTFGGERFYELYLAFSSYVLSKTLEKNGVKVPSRPVITQENYSTTKDILQLSTVQYMQKFKDIQKITSSNHYIWSKLTRNLSQCLQKLKELLKSNEELLKAQQNILGSVGFPESLNRKKLFEKCVGLNFKETISQGKKLKQFFNVESKLWQYIASEVDENKEHVKLDGQEFNICSNNTPEEWCAEFEKVGFVSSNENRKLSIVRFIKLLMVYLKFLIETLMKADLSQLHRTCSIEDASNIEENLNYISNLIEKLEDGVIPNTEKSIQNLKSVSCFEDTKKTSNLSSCQACSSVPVLSFNPTAVKDRLPHLNPGEILQLYSDEKSNNVPTDSSSDVEEHSLGFLNLSNPVSLINNHAVTNIASRAEVTMTADSSLPDISKSEKPSDVFLSHISEVADNKPPQSSMSIITLSSLDDLDFVPSTRFEMRGSWLQEESLNSVTLPDLDNSECFA